MDRKNGLCTGHNHGHHHHSDDGESHDHSHMLKEDCPWAKMEKEIEGCHSLNTILTSQKYIGLFDMHDMNKDKDNEEHEEEHRLERLK